MFTYRLILFENSSLVHDTHTYIITCIGTTTRKTQVMLIVNHIVIQNHISPIHIRIKIRIETGTEQLDFRISRNRILISEFWVRGISTFGANASALILIDGVEGDLNTLDPADIESFSVLKDASATAVYGVRGANGVVIVTTKRGKAGKLTVNFKTNATYSYSPRMPE